MVLLPRGIAARRARNAAAEFPDDANDLWEIKMRPEPGYLSVGVSRRCHPSRPLIPEECEVNRLHAEAVMKRKEAAEEAAERKRKRKAKHDKVCKIARAEGKPRMRKRTPRTPRPTSRVMTGWQQARILRRSGAVAMDAAPLAPIKALKTGAHAMPHSAPQPPPIVDIVAEAAKLREEMARGAQATQQVRVPGNGSDAGQSSIEAAAPADAVGEAARGGADGAVRPVAEVQAGRSDANSAARPVAEEGAGGGAQERPASQTEVETLIPEPPRVGVEGVAEEESAPRAPVVEETLVSVPAEAQDEGVVAAVTAQVVPENVLDEGTSEGPHHGAIIQSEVPPEFLHDEQEEEAVWQA
ncbi:transcriptional regulatory protein AlgP-like [Panicum virgatum]|uniref:transcriptional regulatory protein AlgP-like n=1 Tax=Panicum virgatum TaxID=38727 RepID=UPI0019D5E89D|nr:transcriptional regulatory protein AlgP-like [Panicum virgatum]